MIRELSRGLPAFAVLLSALVVSSASRSADAAVILQPASASTNMGELFPASRMRDQSGLSTPYTSLVTDFDGYIAAGPTAEHGFGLSVWGSPPRVRSGNFDLALGGSYEISAMALWNAVGDPSALRDFRLLAAGDAAFTAPIDLGTFTALNTAGSYPKTAAQVFAFAPTRASHVRIEVLSTASSTSYGAVANEVAFRATVPEPGACAPLLALAWAAVFRPGRSGGAGEINAKRQKAPAE